MGNTYEPFGLAKSINPSFSWSSPSTWLNFNNSDPYLYTGGDIKPGAYTMSNPATNPVTNYGTSPTLGISNDTIAELMSSGNAAGSGVFGLGTKNQWDTGLGVAQFGLGLADYFQKQPLFEKQLRLLEQQLLNNEQQMNTRNQRSSELNNIRLGG